MLSLMPPPGENIRFQCQVNENQLGGDDMAVTYVNVRYTKENYGITPRRLLDELIAANKIIQFYRESEKKWVTVGTDPIRGMGGVYAGPERRLI